MLNTNANYYNIEKKNFNFKHRHKYVTERILQFSEHFNIDNWNVNNDKQMKQILQTFFCKLFSIISFFFLILLRKGTLESKVATTNRNSSVFLLYTSKTFSNFELFSIFSQTFVKQIFATKIKKMLLKQSAVLFTGCQENIAYIMCLNT